MAEIDRRPSLADLRRVIRKPSYDRDRPFRNAMWFLRPWQVYLTYVLIRLRFGPNQVTCLWFVITLIAYAVMTMGSTWAIILGSLLIYLKIILDGCDGEVARFQKQFVSPERDAKDFVNGLYLDKVFHAIETPLWAPALALGLYRSGRISQLWPGPGWLAAAVVAFSVFVTFRRFHSLVQLQLPSQFVDLARRLSAPMAGHTTSTAKYKISLPMRLLEKVGLWLGNGKRFNFSILVLALADLTLELFHHKPIAIYSFLLISGGLCPLIIARIIADTVLRDRLYDKAVQLAQHEPQLPPAATPA